MFSRCVMSQVKHNSYFIVGLVLGLWVSLAVIPLDEEPVACASSLEQAASPPDEFEPQREERPLGPAGQTAGRTVQRPRYYSTELGMRGSLLTGVLSSEEALKNQVAALNHTAARLQPALKFFITASAMSSVPGLANVVGFTDTREMLKPFHALKYLADNYLEEYDFFFLVSDTAFVNAQRLKELVSRLSVSQDVYMGTIAEDDSHYCSLESGIVLSNSVLRAVHNELDWCVRNSYSPHHHENIGRCVLHAAHLSCTTTLQGEQYTSLHIDSAEVPSMAQLVPLPDAVTAHPLTNSKLFYQLHAYVSRVYLERSVAETRRLRAYVWRNSGRHPAGARNATWPGGLRADPGLAPPLPDSRFDHLRWTPFNATHAFMPDDHRTLTALAGADRQAVDLVLESVRAWALEHWDTASEVQLVEGAWCWEPAAALRYRLLLRLTAREPDNTHTMRLVEVVRPLGAARLVPVRYVTESARVTLVLPVRTRDSSDALAFLPRYEAVALRQDKNTALVLVLVHASSENSTAATGAVREAAVALADKHRGVALDVVDALADAETLDALDVESARRAALAAALPRVSRDALLLLAAPHMEFNQDFLNRVRMNTISGEQWFLPVGFSRHALYAHPKFVSANGGKPQLNTGRFNLHTDHVLAFYRSDYDAATSSWTGASDAPIAARLAAAPLRGLRAPEPGLVLTPRPPPCSSPAPDGDAAACLRRLRDADFATLDLGARHSLARLLLETQAELDA